MTKVYLVRHCEALGNVKQIFQGTTDMDITELGKQQLDELKKRFDNVYLDRVISSPLIRTKKTAEAIIGDKNLPLETDDGLIEINGGVIEGKPFAESYKKYPELLDIWANRPHEFAPEGGESYKETYERIWKTIKRIATDNKGKTIACATHGGVTRCIICRLLYNDISQLINTPYFANTAVSLIEFDDELNPKLVFYNDYSHLPPEIVNRLSRIVVNVEEDVK